MRRWQTSGWQQHQQRQQQRQKRRRQQQMRAGKQTNLINLILTIVNAYILRLVVFKNTPNIKYFQRLIFKYFDLKNVYC